MQYFNSFLRSFLLTGCLLLTLLKPSYAQNESVEPIIYSVTHRVFMGEDNETPKKDFYINLGSRHGVQMGSKILVTRKVASFDLVNKRLFKDMNIPIGYLKVIHVENSAAIARLDQMLDPEKRPALAPDAIVVGDSVALSR